jgi:oligopeptide/dipeptide ABC transporter ATP-binding protein
VVEQGSVDDIFADHHHPYTHGLLRSVPRLDRPAEDLVKIKGIVPRLDDLPAGCAFSKRCDYVMDQCRQLEPELKEINPGHCSRCWLEKTPWQSERTETPFGTRTVTYSGRLKKYFPLGRRSLSSRGPVVKAVDGVSFELGRVWRRSVAAASCRRL